MQASCSCAALFLVNMAVMMNSTSRLSIMIFVRAAGAVRLQVHEGDRGLYDHIPLHHAPADELRAADLRGPLTSRFRGHSAAGGQGGCHDLQRSHVHLGISMATGRCTTAGMVFGRGYMGQYELAHAHFLAAPWGRSDSSNFHLHSSFLEMTDGSGRGRTCAVLLVWNGFSYYRKDTWPRTFEAPLFAGHRLPDVHLADRHLLPWHVSRHPISSPCSRWRRLTRSSYHARRNGVERNSSSEERSVAGYGLDVNVG